MKIISFFLFVFCMIVSFEVHAQNNESEMVERFEKIYDAIRNSKCNNKKTTDLALLRSCVANVKNTLKNNKYKERYPIYYRLINYMAYVSTSEFEKACKELQEAYVLYLMLNEIRDINQKETKIKDYNGVRVNQTTFNNFFGYEQTNNNRCSQKDAENEYEKRKKNNGKTDKKPEPEPIPEQPDPDPDPDPDPNPDQKKPDQKSEPKKIAEDQKLSQNNESVKMVINNDGSGKMAKKDANGNILKYQSAKEPLAIEALKRFIEIGGFDSEKDKFNVTRLAKDQKEFMQDLDPEMSQYLLDFTIWFDGGRYTMPLSNSAARYQTTNGRVFPNPAVDKFIKNALPVVEKLGGKENYLILFEGSADIVPINGGSLPLVAMYDNEEFTEIKVFNYENGELNYEIINVPQNYTNEHLPDLRAAFIKKILARNATVEEYHLQDRFVVHKGKIEPYTDTQQRNCIIVFAINWKKAKEYNQKLKDEWNEK